MNNLILYGIGDAKYQYRVLKYFCIYDERIDIAEIKRIARTMQVINPSIVTCPFIKIKAKTPCIRRPASSQVRRS